MRLIGKTHAQTHHVKTKKSKSVLMRLSSILLASKIMSNGFIGIDFIF
ncbi:hypothetical protein HPHPP1_0722 [Helicobacter pylori Hp P-1]|nr:hypothetical protein HPHPP1_0722 [Helicobacter pylori Hp P-1]